MAELYGRLGDSGLKVSKIICGTMTLGLKKYFGDNESESVVEDEESILKILNECYENGIRTFDTANVYSGGFTESMIGKWIEKYNIPRKNIIIMTKVFGFVEDEYGIKEAMTKRNPLDRVNNQGLSRKNIFDSVEESLKRMNTDYIDILQIHRFDYETSIEETMRALNDLINMGKVRYIGASSMKTYQFIKMQNLAESKKWFKFISMQNYYNLIYREEEREMIPYCEEENVGLLPWAPLARGHLTKLPSANTKGKDSWFSSHILGINTNDKSTSQILTNLNIVATKRDTSMAVIAIAWLINKGCYPVVGINKVERVQELVKAIEIELTDEELVLLEDNYLPQLNNLLK